MIPKLHRTEIYQRQTFERLSSAAKRKQSAQPLPTAASRRSKRGEELKSVRVSRSECGNHREGKVCASVLNWILMMMMMTTGAVSESKKPPELLLKRSDLVASALENRTSSRFGRARTERKALKCALILMAGPIMWYLHSQLPAEEQNNIYILSLRGKKSLFCWFGAMQWEDVLPFSSLPHPFLFTLVLAIADSCTRGRPDVCTARNSFSFFSPLTCFGQIFLSIRRDASLARQIQTLGAAAQTSACVILLYLYVYCSVFCDVFPSPRDPVTTAEQQPRLQDARFE